MKKKISLILIILGLILILIPIGGNIYNKNKQDEMIRDFEETFQTVSSTDEGEPLKEGEFVIVDINSNDNSKIDIGSVIGIIHIPRIELTLPLMEGTTEKVKQLVEEAKTNGILSELPPNLCKEAYKTNAKIFKVL